ncbi:MAG: ATP-binding protein, partial [Candidatus Rokuibacteriota bacterium]
MGETRVDLLHLLEDLRDAYPGPLEETILTEIVANALDSGASRIRIATDPAAATLTVSDDGSGMRRRELARYHDVAASAKTRGESIGFAGVGIKLGLLVCEEVLTETRRGATHVATRWHLVSRHRAPWRWVPPTGLTEGRGTGVRLKLQNLLSPLLDPGFLEATLRRHYQPLLDPAFDEILVPHYRRGVAFEVNGRTLERGSWKAAEAAAIAVRLARKRKPSAIGYLLRVQEPLPEERRGLAISTLGKVIKQGWDWVGVSPAVPERVSGLVEVPALAGSLALNKADFIRAGARGAIYLAYRKGIQEAVAHQLAVWGDARDAHEDTHRRLARPLERDLERVLADLAEDFPLLATLVERRSDGQRRLPIGRAGKLVGLAVGV